MGEAKRDAFALEEDKRMLTAKVADLSRKLQVQVLSLRRPGQFLLSELNQILLGHFYSMVIILYIENTRFSG